MYEARSVMFPEEINNEQERATMFVNLEEAVENTMSRHTLKSSERWRQSMILSLQFAKINILLR